MIAPRRRFAAPFVLVVGCSGGASSPAPPPVRPEPPRIDAAIDTPSDAPAEPAAVAPADASLVAVGPDARTTDAGTPDPMRPPRFHVDPCTLPPDPGNPTCNPRPPDALEARIITSERTDRGLVIGVLVANEPRVDTRWRAQLLDGAGRLVATEKLVIIRADRRIIYMRVTGPTELPPDARVRLSPP